MRPAALALAVLLVLGCGGTRPSSIAVAAAKKAAARAPTCQPSEADRRMPDWRNRVLGDHLTDAFLLLEEAVARARSSAIGPP